LFRAGGPQADSAKQDVLLLDGVLDDARQLRQRGGASDLARETAQVSSAEPIQISGRSSAAII